MEKAFMIIVAWPAVQAASFLAVAVLDRWFSIERFCCKVSGVFCFAGGAGTLMCEVAFRQMLLDPMALVMIGTTLIGASVTVLRVSWMQVYSHLNYRHVQFASSLFIAFGSAVFLICNTVPRELSFALICAFPFASYALLKKYRRQTVHISGESASLEAEIECGQVRAYPVTMLLCLFVFGVANSYIRGLGLSLFNAEGGASALLLFTSIVILGFVLAFAKSQKYIYNGATLMAVGGLMFLVFPETYALGTSFIGAGFICIEVIVWMVGAELSKMNRAHSARIVSITWLVIYCGSVAGIVIGKFVSFERLATATGLIASMALIYGFVVLLALSFSRSFMDIFEPAPEQFQPSGNPQIQCIAASMEYTLTKRETEILELLVNGKKPRNIEQELVISQNTVKYHIKNIYEKIGVNSREELIEKVLSCKAAFLDNPGHEKA